MTLTRRQLLAGLGAGGALALGSSVALAGRDPSYTRYTYAATPDIGDSRRLRIAWYESYNGAVLETQSGIDETNASVVLDPDSAPLYVDGVSGPAITVGNVLPGDSGLLALGLTAEEVQEDDDAVDVWLRVGLTADSENGVNEPESLADGEDDPVGPTSGDDDPARPAGTGELADALEVLLWKDGSPGSLLGCNGSDDPTETVVADDSLTAFAGDVSDGLRLVDCLPQGATRCLGFRWELPAGVGNRAQSDSVAFELEFVGVPCDSGNPFGDGGSQ